MPTAIPGLTGDANDNSAPRLMSSLPCVGCGWCCLTDQCVESHIKHGYRERCPEVFWDNDLRCYRCRLSADDSLRRLLGIGEGCCAPLNPWRDDVKDRCRG